MVFEKAGGRGIVWRYFGVGVGVWHLLQTVAVIIDISGAYDNVLIDILCDFLRGERGTSADRESMTLVGYKGLPQRSVLRPFLYNLGHARIGSSHLDVDCGTTASC
jgi:hypothetical protein